MAHLATRRLAHLHTKPSSLLSSLHTKRSLLLGRLCLHSPLILAPLERVSDIGFRRLCFDQGAALTWTEMIYASDLARHAPAAVHSIDTHDADVPTGVQIVVDKTSARASHGLDLLCRALQALEQGAATHSPHWQNIRAVDLNFGCPAPSLARRGAGPSQLRRRSKVAQLFRALHDWRQSTCLDIAAVGAKIRLGMNRREQDFEVYLPVAEAAAGVLDYLAVHARHGEQRSRDPPSWEAIAKIKARVGSALPIIGNGDVRTRCDMREMLALTGCDAVMVGRAAMNNPWSLRQLADQQKQHEPSSTSGWPSLAALDAAEQAWEAATQRLPGRHRFEMFSRQNFARIRRECMRADEEQSMIRTQISCRSA